MRQPEADTPPTVTFAAARVASMVPSVSSELLTSRPTTETEPSGRVTSKASPNSERSVASSASKSWTSPPRDLQRRVSRLAHLDLLRRYARVPYDAGKPGETARPRPDSEQSQVGPAGDAQDPFVGIRVAPDDRLRARSSGRPGEERDSFVLGERDGLCVEHPGARLGERPHLFVRKLRQTNRVRDEAGIGRVDAVDIAVELAGLGAEGGSESHAGGVRAAAPERRDLALVRHPLVSGYDHDAPSRQLVLHAHRAHLR